MLQRIKAAALAAAIWLAPIAGAFAQSQPPSPGGVWPYGFVPTVAQWQAAWANKADYLGSPPCLSIGCTLSGKLTLAPSTAASSGLNCGAGTAPTTPINGDVWCTSAGMFIYAGSTTIGPFGPGISSTVTVPQGGTGVTTLASGRAVIGQGASAVTTYPLSGTGTTVASTTGTLTNGHCVSIGAAGDLIDAGGACTTGGGGGTVSSGTGNQLAYYASTGTTVAGLSTCNSGYYGTNGSGVPSCATTLSSTLQGNITAVGTVASGTWQGTLVGATYGGTGVNNGSSTITLGGSLTMSGSFTTTLTVIGNTNVTLPTSGTIPNSSGTSGGVPYYNTSTSIASSAALTANLPVFGGGAGAAPFVGTRLGNTTKAQMANSSTSPVTNDCVSYDANGNTQDSGQPCGSANAAPVLLATLTASSSTSLTDVGNCSTGASTGCLSTTYAAYRIDFNQLVAGTPGTGVGCQIAVWNGSYQTTGYVTGGTLSATPATYIPCWPVQSGLGANTLGAPGVSGSITVFNPGAIGKAPWVGTFGVVTGSTGAPSTFVQAVTGWWNTSAALSGFRMCFGTAGGFCAGTIASGTIKVYGLP